MIECPACWRNFPDDCGQAAAVREYGRCLACCITAEKLNGFEWSLERVNANQAAYLERHLEGLPKPLASEE